MNIQGILPHYSKSLLPIKVFISSWITVYNKINELCSHIDKIEYSKAIKMYIEM